MSKEEFKKICELDEIAEQEGGYVDCGDEPVHYDYRAILEYCRQKNMEPIDMTIREMQRFVIN